MMDANAHIAESATGPLGWPRTVAPGCAVTDENGHRILWLEWPSPGEDREQYILIYGRNGRAMPEAQHVLGDGAPRAASPGLPAEASVAYARRCHSGVTWTVTLK